MARLGRDALVAIVVAAAAPAALARAQDGEDQGAVRDEGTEAPPLAAADERTLAVARELYEAGVRAAAAERWSEAADAFTRSYGMVPTAPALGNLLTAQLALGRFVAARQSARTLLGRTDLSPNRRAWAERMEADAAARIATIEVSGLDAGVRVALDGADVDPARFGAGTVALPVDPGAHTVVVERAGQRPRVHRMELAAGGQRTVHVLPAPELEPPRRAESALGPEADPEPGSLLSEPAFWIAAGGVVAIVAAAVVLAFALDAPDDQRLTPRTSVVHEL